MVWIESVRPLPLDASILQEHRLSFKTIFEHLA